MSESVSAGEESYFMAMVSITGTCSMGEFYYRGTGLTIVHALTDQEGSPHQLVGHKKSVIMIQNSSSVYCYIGIGGIQGRWWV